MQAVQYNVTDKEIKELKESSRDTMYLDGTLYGKLTPLCVLNNGKIDGILFDCYCGCKAFIKLPALIGHNKSGKLKTLSCGRERRAKEELALSRVSEKFEKSVDNPVYCKNCDSYRPKITKSRCDDCNTLKYYGVVLKSGEPFEDLMRDWDPETGDPETKWLPILKGTKSKGYNIAGKTLIDTAWYEDCSKYLWVFSNHGYVLMNLSKDNLARRGLTKPKGKTLSIKLHRYVSGVSNDVPLHVDHTNGDTLDNTCKNLRLASRRDNARNSTKTKGTSKYKGVTVRENYSKVRKECTTYFQAQITIGGKKHSKCFDSEIDAAKYYDDYIREHYPSGFNVYNFPREGENSVFR